MSMAVNARPIFHTVRIVSWAVQPDRQVPGDAITPDRQSPRRREIGQSGAGALRSGAAMEVTGRMDEPTELRNNRHWKMAVWALRLGYLGLAVVIVGIVVMWSGSTAWVLGAGVFIWLAAATVTLTGVFWARSELPEPRPGLWPMRWMLLRDTVHARRSA